MNWPIGLNKEMDELVATRGFTHWSCVSPMSNSFWIRKGGLEVYFDDPRKSLIEVLEDADFTYPLIEGSVMEKRTGLDNFVIWFYRLKD